MTIPSRFRDDESESSPIDSSIPKLGLKRNPFPISPVVVINSENEVSNGGLFNPKVRANAVKAFEEQFIDIDFSDPQHLKLGYLWSIPVGRESRGFGKTAMLAYYLRKINKNYGMDLPRSQKVAAIYEEPTQDTNSFKKLAAILCGSLLRRDPITKSAILTDIIRTIRFKIIQREKQPPKRLLDYLEIPSFQTEADFEILTNPTWVGKWKAVDFHKVMKAYLIVEAGLGEQEAELLAVYDDRSTFAISRWMAREPVKFLFNDTVKLLSAAGFRGLYIFIDDLYDGINGLSKRGRDQFANDVRDYFISGTQSEAANKAFFTAIMTFHPGLQNLLLDSWHEPSRLDQIAHFDSRRSPGNNVELGLLDREDTIELLKAYTEYAIADDEIKAHNPLHPLTSVTAQILMANRKISPGKLLEDAYKLIEKAKRDGEAGPLSENYVQAFVENRIEPEIRQDDTQEDFLDM